MNLSDAVLNKLREFRSAPVGLKDFQEWVRGNHDVISQQISQGCYLRLSRGDLAKVMSALSNLLPGCHHCEGVWRCGVFESRLEHSACAEHVEMAIKRGDLRRIKRPLWIQPDHSQIGADAYFICEACESVWTLVEPERQDNGLWGRVA